MMRLVRSRCKNFVNTNEVSLSDKDKSFSHRNHSILTQLCHMIRVVRMVLTRASVLTYFETAFGQTQLAGCAEQSKAAFAALWLYH